MEERQNQARRKQLSPRRIAQWERQAKALELRKAGYSFEVIARQMGYPSPGNAYRAITSILKRTIQQPADEARAMEIERLDRLMIAVWQKAIAGDTSAIDRVLRIMERRAQLLGLDAPATVDIELRVRAEALARGIDPDVAVHAAEEIIRQRRGT